MKIHPNFKCKPEAATVPEQGAIRGRLPRLVGLLRCAYAWEWRNRRVVVAYGRLWRDLFDGVAALMMAVVTIPLTLLRLIISPLSGCSLPPSSA